VSATDTFLRARDFLLREREDYDAAYRGFAWPQLDTFNWALDWFDAYARGNDRLGLWLRDDAGGDVKRTFAELSERWPEIARSCA